MAAFQITLSTGRSVRVRVWADDPLIIAAMAPLLREAGADVEDVDEAEAELDLVAGSVEVIDPDTPAVVLAAGPDDARTAWQAGARGLLARDVDGEALLQALLAVAQGLVVFDAAFAEDLAPTPAPLPDVTESLTEREREVLALLAEGLPNKLIADRLGVTERTARYHVAQILGKLGAQSRTDAVVRGARLGLVVL